MVLGGYFVFTIYCVNVLRLKKNTKYLYPLASFVLPPSWSQVNTILMIDILSVKQKSYSYLYF